MSTLLAQAKPIPKWITIKVIDKVDMSTLKARVEPIPKWISIQVTDIQSPIPRRRVMPKSLKQESTLQMPSRQSVEPSKFAAEHNLMPLLELAKVMYEESNEAVAKGLLPSKNVEEKHSSI